MTKMFTHYKDVGDFVPVRERRVRVGMQGGLRMRKVLLMSMAVVLVGLCAAPTAWAGAKIQINDDSMIDLGFRVQSQFMVNDADIDTGDEGWEKETNFKVRRARFRLKGVINQYMEGFLQTDASTESGGTGADARVIDAFIVVKPDPWARFYVGLNMAPILRQNLTSSGALMAIDRPGFSYKSLAWGARSRAQFTNRSAPGADSGLRAGDGVRDNGVTLFGSGEVGDQIHAKYYVGMYDGIQPAGRTEDNDRYTGRVQVNFGDAEGGYYNSSTYLGKKKTIGIGAAFDTQSGVALDGDGENIDYTMFTVDGFLEQPVGDGSLTVEGGFAVLDFDDAITFAADGTTVIHDYNADQGTGFYAQAGFLVNEKWQPWAMYENWSSDSDADVGNYTALRVGVTYFVQGHNANIKAGFESFQTDNDIITNEDTLTSFLVGTYITY